MYVLCLLRQSRVRGIYESLDYPVAALQYFWTEAPLRAITCSLASPNALLARSGLWATAFCLPVTAVVRIFANLEPVD